MCAFCKLSLHGVPPFNDTIFYLEAVIFCFFTLTDTIDRVLPHKCRITLLPAYTAYVCENPTNHRFFLLFKHFVMPYFADRYAVSPFLTESG